MLAGCFLCVVEEVGGGGGWPSLARVVCWVWESVCKVFFFTASFCISFGRAEEEMAQMAEVNECKSIQQALLMSKTFSNDKNSST